MATRETPLGVDHPTVVPRGPDGSGSDDEDSDGQAGAGERAAWWAELIQ